MARPLTCLFGKTVFQVLRILLVFGRASRMGEKVSRAVFICQWLSCTPFTQGHFWCHHCIPCPWKYGFWYTICHTFDILNQVICVIVLMVAISDPILNLTPSARDPDCPPKFFFTYLWVHYQDQESKWEDIWLHTGPPSARGLSVLAENRIWCILALNASKWAYHIYLQSSHQDIFLANPVIVIVFFSTPQHKV